MGQYLNDGAPGSVHTQEAQTASEDFSMHNRLLMLAVAALALYGLVSLMLMAVRLVT